MAPGGSFGGCPCRGSQGWPWDESILEDSLNSSPSCSGMVWSEAGGCHPNAQTDMLRAVPRGLASSQLCVGPSRVLRPRTSSFGVRACGPVFSVVEKKESGVQGRWRGWLQQLPLQATPLPQPWEDFRSQSLPAGCLFLTLSPGQNSFPLVL